MRNIDMQMQHKSKWKQTEMKKKKGKEAARSSPHANEMHNEG